MLLPHMAENTTPRQEAVRSRLSTNLKVFRGKQSMSQEALADRAGVHRTQINKIEQGLVNVKLDTLVALADALGVSEVQLLLEPVETPIPLRAGPRQAPDAGDFQ